MCIFGKKIPKADEPPTPPAELKPMQFVDDGEDASKRKTTGTKRLQIPMGGTGQASGIGIPL